MLAGMENPGNAGSAKVSLASQAASGIGGAGNAKIEPPVDIVELGKAVARVEALLPPLLSVVEFAVFFFINSVVAACIVHPQAVTGIVVNDVDRSRTDACSDFELRVAGTGGNGCLVPFAMICDTD